MINYFFEQIPSMDIATSTTEWLTSLVEREGKKVGEISYIFCDDEYLLSINKTYLQHDYYTDIITFDYVKGSLINADIFVSLPRVLENSKSLSTTYDQELHRVLAHGLLHLCGYKDKTEEQEAQMRAKENFYLEKR
ncbi:rRNA maturation RNase YbeY [Chryseobacterium sp. A301]